MKNPLNCNIPKPGQPQDTTYWYLDIKDPNRLKAPLETDVVIVGGGMAGLTAAQKFRERGADVVLLEQYKCGGGASGKSSGFITPDSELGLRHLIKHHGKDETKHLWDFVTSGVDHINDTIKKNNIQCDYAVQDTLVLANSTGAFKDIKDEHTTRLEMGYESTLYQKNDLAAIISSTNYYGGVSYGGTFGINAFKYCQAVKHILESNGVTVYEETPVLSIANDHVMTQNGSVRAKHIIVAADRFIPSLGKLTSDIFHAQTFLMISAPLSESDLRKIFPSKSFMAWDTDLIYTYFRITSDNRLLLGGGSLLTTFSCKEEYHSRVFNKLERYFKKKFPDVNVHFEYRWPGLIGLAKDIMPIAGNDPQMPNVYYIGACAGLPWAAALGAYSAQKICENRSDLDSYFAIDRAYPIGHTIQRIIGTPATFALSNLLTLYTPF